MTNDPSSFDPLALCRPHLRDLDPYVPGEQPDRQVWTKLNTNENPFPPSPRVADAIRGALESLAYYPQPDSRRLREAIARHHGLTADRVIAGNGSDDVLNLLIRVFGGRDRAVGAMDPSYSLYPILCGIQEAPFRGIPYTASMEIPIEAIAGCGCSLFFLTTPNAPTGAGYSEDVLRSTAAAFPGIMVFDEAYVAFSNSSAVSLLDDFPNAVVTRSFSKSHGLAGLRVGYALASPQIIGLLDRVRDSYNLDALAQVGAVAALEDAAYLEQTRQAVIATREKSRQRLEAMGWRVFPSQANFLCAEPVNGRGESGVDVAGACFAFLKSRKILVRFFPGQSLVGSYLRISIGTQDQMDLLHAALDDWTEETRSA